MKKNRIDLAFWLIAAIGPALWVLDALAVSILFKTDFLRQLLFPRSFDLVLGVLLILFPLLVAILFHPRPPDQEQLEERQEIEESVRKEEKLKCEQAVEACRQKADEHMKEVEAGFAQDMESRLEEERKRAEDTISSLKKKCDDLVLQARNDEATRTTDSIRMQERAESAERIKVLQAGFAQELEMKLAAERKLIEVQVRQEEQKKARDFIAEFQQKLEAQLRSGAEHESQAVVDAIRREEQAKADERLKALETKTADERKRIEEAVRLQEQKNAENAVRSLRQKYEEMMKSGQDDEKKRAVDLIRMEEQKKMAEQIRSLEEKYSQQISSRLAEERKRIEDAVRAEEQKKAEEAVRALRQRYEEQLRAGKAAAPASAPAPAPAPDPAQERTKIEAALKAEMEKRIKSAVPPPAPAAAAPVAAAAQTATAATVQVPALSKLVTGMSQQIMNPLAGVLNNLKLIKIKMLQGGDMKSKEIKEALDMMEDSAFLCKNILSSMSLPAAGSRAAAQPVALNTIVAKIDALMGNEMKLQNISIQKVLQENLSPVIGDAWLLTQVLFNIVSNAKWAIKSNPMAHAGTITITTRMSSAEDKVELLVSDNGIGISGENRARIFEPFFTTKQDGLGLGLTVAQNIIKAHNGDIQMESKEDKGTTFTITLPAAKG